MHVGEEMCNEILRMIGENVKIYRCCNDSEYIFRGNVEAVFRVIENEEERVLIDFYVVD